MTWSEQEGEERAGSFMDCCGHCNGDTEFQTFGPTAVTEFTSPDVIFHTPGQFNSLHSNTQVRVNADYMVHNFSDPGKGDWFQREGRNSGASGEQEVTSFIGG